GAHDDDAAGLGGRRAYEERAVALRRLEVHGVLRDHPSVDHRPEVEDALAEHVRRQPRGVEELLRALRAEGAEGVFALAAELGGEALAELLGRLLARRALAERPREDDAALSDRPVEEPLREGRDEER